jgi:hypothetical protein
MWHRADVTLIIRVAEKIVRLKIWLHNYHHA